HAPLVYVVRMGRTFHVYASQCIFFFFFNDTATTEIYTLSLHDALPISVVTGSASGLGRGIAERFAQEKMTVVIADNRVAAAEARSEEHTSELQSRGHLVCRLLLEKKKIINSMTYNVWTNTLDKQTRCMV